MTKKFLDHIAVPQPTDPAHPATKQYVDDEIANVGPGGGVDGQTISPSEIEVVGSPESLNRVGLTDDALYFYRALNDDPEQGWEMQAAIQWDSVFDVLKIINGAADTPFRFETLPTLTDPTDVAHKQYVDDAVSVAVAPPTVYRQAYYPVAELPVADDGIGVHTLLIDDGDGNAPIVDFYNTADDVREITLQVSFPEINVSSGDGQTAAFIRNVTVYVGKAPHLLTFLYEEQTAVGELTDAMVSLPPRTVERKFILAPNDRLSVQIYDSIDAAMVENGNPTTPLVVQGGPDVGGEFVDVTLRSDVVSLEVLPDYVAAATAATYGTTGAMVNVDGSFFEKARYVELYAADDMFGTPVVRVYNPDHPDFSAEENDHLGIIEAYDGNTNDHIGANFVPFSGAKIVAAPFAWARYYNQPIEVGRVTTHDTNDNVVDDFSPVTPISMPPIPKVYGWWSPEPNRFILIGDFHDPHTAGGLNNLGIRFAGTSGDAGNDALYRAPTSTVVGAGNAANDGAVTINRWDQNIIDITDTRWATWYGGNAPDAVSGFYMHSGDFQYYYYEPRLDPAQHGLVDGNGTYPLDAPTISSIALYDAANLALFNPTWDDDAFDGWTYGLSISGTNLVGPVAIGVQYNGGASENIEWYPVYWANDFENASIMVNVSSLAGETISGVVVYADTDGAFPLLTDTTTPDLPLVVPV